LKHLLLQHHLLLLHAELHCHTLLLLHLLLHSQPLLLKQQHL
jgi:hypothetical protein